MREGSWDRNASSNVNDVTGRMESAGDRNFKANVNEAANKMEAANQLNLTNVISDIDDSLRPQNANYRREFSQAVNLRLENDGTLPRVMAEYALNDFAALSRDDKNINKKDLTRDAIDLRNQHRAIEEGLVDELSSHRPNVRRDHVFLGFGRQEGISKSRLQDYLQKAVSEEGVDGSSTRKVPDETTTRTINSPHVVAPEKPTEPGSAPKSANDKGVIEVKKNHGQADYQSTDQPNAQELHLSRHITIDKVNGCPSCITTENGYEMRLRYKEGSKELVGYSIVDLKRHLEVEKAERDADHSWQIQHRNLQTNRMEKYTGEKIVDIHLDKNLNMSRLEESCLDAEGVRHEGVNHEICTSTMARLKRDNEGRPVEVWSPDRAQRTQITYDGERRSPCAFSIRNEHNQIMGSVELEREADEHQRTKWHVDIRSPDLGGRGRFFQHPKGFLRRALRHIDDQYRGRTITATT